jgi:hypothetical protein
VVQGRISHTGLPDPGEGFNLDPPGGEIFRRSVEEGMSVSARARTLTNRELVNLYELSTAEEQRDLAHELYKRVFKVVHGGDMRPQQQPAQTQLL